ncbi:MAG: ecdysteroid 22-kinase family protein, partial [Acidimicrobiia bacterium]|nr:ecdysteroid 22-kinase family protein [Acidimicrobiia bacterium]
MSPGALDRLDQLDPVWVTAALRHGGTLGSDDPVVAGVELERVGATTGFLGVLARVHLGWSQPGAGAGPTLPRTVVVKLPTADPGGRSVGRMLDVWRREAAFFAELAPALGGAVPRCLFNAAEPDTERYTLLLEDCGPDVDADQVAGATGHQARQAVATLARIQAPFWGGPRATEWLPGFDRPRFEALQGAMAASLGAFTERYAARLPEAGIEAHRRIVAELPAWAQRVAHTPLSLVHADYRLDNLLYRADGSVTVVDWQTTLWGPGAMDLSSLLATSLTIESRRRLEPELIELYMTTLRDAGAVVDEAQVRESYRGCLLWW